VVYEDICQKILIGKGCILNDKFAQMASHYLFEPITCTPGSGWEKGQVEKQVGDTKVTFLCQCSKKRVMWSSKQSREPF
jgi:transposase